MNWFPRNRLKHVTGRTWTNSDNFQFPELNPAEPSNVTGRPNIGVCFSGGGSRSASCTHGQLRALRHLQLEDKIRYFSCVSGGSWAALPYVYLPWHYPDSHFLGKIRSARELTPDLLNFVSDRNYLRTVTNASLAEKMLMEWLSIAGDESFSRVIGEVFLKPFNLNDRSKLFTYTAVERDALLENNDKAYESDFYTVRQDRPFLIVGGTLLRKYNSRDYLFEMTPWYCGVLNQYRDAGHGGQHIGGGYVESLLMDSDAPDDIRDTVKVRIGSKRHRFTLSDVIGVSGAAPAEVLQNMGLRSVGFPEFKYWSMVNDATQTLKAKEYEFGDGGNLENLGILPLIRRGVEKIIVFANTKRELQPNQLNQAIADLFETGNVNQIFAEARLENLLQQLNTKKQSNEAVIARQSLTTIENAHHAIQAGQNVEILWVYNESFGRWIQELPAATRAMLDTGELQNFPHYKTFGENLPRVIELKNIQANLLSQHSAAVILENASTFVDFCNL